MFACSTFRRLSLFAVAICLALAPEAARAAGVKVIKQKIVQGKPEAPEQVFNDPQYFDREIQDAWTEARPQTTSDIVADLSKANRFGNGFTPYHINLTLASSGPVGVQRYGYNAVMVTYTLNNSYLRFTSTVPGPTPKSMDPTIDVHFDTTYSALIGLPMNGAKTKLTWSNTEITRVHATSRSVLVGLATTFVNLFSNGGARVSLENRINLSNEKMKKQIESRLARLDALVAGLRAQGYTKLMSEVQNGQLVLTAINNVSAPLRVNPSAIRPLNTHLNAFRDLPKLNPGERVGLNPQPLPPRNIKSLLLR